MLAVIANEGGHLDSLNTWDGSGVSFGLFQRTSQSGELANFLWTLQERDPDAAFDDFGQYGLHAVFNDGALTIEYDPEGDGAPAVIGEGTGDVFNEVGEIFVNAAYDSRVQAVEFALVDQRLEGLLNMPIDVPGLEGTLGDYLNDEAAAQLLDYHDLQQRRLAHEPIEFRGAIQRRMDAIDAALGA